MKYKDCKTEEDLKKLEEEVRALEEAYKRADDFINEKLDILSTPGINADKEEEWWDERTIRSWGP